MTIFEINTNVLYHKFTQITRFAGFLLILAVLFAGCKGFNAIEITHIDQFELNGIEDDAISFSASIGIANPAGAGFKVREINLRVLADDSYLGLLTSNQEIKIPARSDSVYNMMFDLRFANLFSGASVLYNISRQEQVTVDLQGYVKTRAGLVFKKVDVQEHQVVEVPQLNYFD